MIPRAGGTYRQSSAYANPVLERAFPMGGTPLWLGQKCGSPLTVTREVKIGVYGRKTGNWCRAGGFQGEKAMDGRA